MSCRYFVTNAVTNNVDCLLLTPWLSLQAKAGQAYDSAAQGTAQAKDYTQVGRHLLTLHEAAAAGSNLCGSVNWVFFAGQGRPGV